MAFLGKNMGDPYLADFREVAISHNVRNSKLFSGIIGLVGLVLFSLNLYTNTSRVFKYPEEYSAAVAFIFIVSGLSYLAFVITQKIQAETKKAVYLFLTNFYAVIIVISSLWITFVMQHNPSNTMSIFVLGILSVAALWIFEKTQTFVIAIIILILFDGGLHYFQTDACKLFANYITGTCVSIFFVCISRVCFSVNYKHFKQLKKVEESNHELIKMSELQTEILSVVAHDLRAPNNRVIGLLDLSQHPTITTSERAEYYELMLESCQLANEIIDDIMQVVRNDGTSPALARHCMNDFIETKVFQYLKSKDHSYHIVYKQSLERLHANINPQKMMRVFENLISNAMKFTPDNGTIIIALEKKDGKIYISISDTGIGIPKKMLPSLFTRFSAAGRTGLKGEKSYGIGLSICKLFLKQQYGDIAAYSDEGHGTQMIITLPMAEQISSN